MRDRTVGSTSRWRVVALACITALGLVTIVGSGGGAGLSVEGCFFPPCAGDFPPEPSTPTVEPASSVVQVGGTTTFSVQAPGITNATIRWFRSQQGGAFNAVPGATSSTYTVPGAQTVDDNAKFSATVTGTFNGQQVTLNSTVARLAVSSMPGIVIQDSDFLPADWTDAAIVEPATNDPTHVAEQATSGGNPGAYRKLSLTLTSGPSKLFVFETFQPVSYDPGSQGPIYLVGFRQDCLALPGTLGVGPTLLIEQDGRRYIGGASATCSSPAWTAAAFPVNFGAADFVRVDGPACVIGQPCPDFTAAGKPIRFGSANSNEGVAGFAGATGGFGIDNWRVTVWRR